MSRCLAALACFVIFLTAIRASAQETFSLAGPWRFQLSGPPTADTPGALPKLKLDDTIDLPGTTESQKKGSLHGPGWNGREGREF